MYIAVTVPDSQLIIYWSINRSDFLDGLSGTATARTTDVM